MLLFKWVIVQLHPSVLECMWESVMVEWEVSWKNKCCQARDDRTDRRVWRDKRQVSLRAENSSGLSRGPCGRMFCIGETTWCPVS